ncbi:hypothetical protein BDV25DRAFT_43056 [Aspergillus avenaceus]|uniref:LDB19 N-terminal domain-containing protein n=1 Tax=Aspergillus avenaceus TaxID=36643 RepID=A0A5N6TLJ7_ASPAV|nr:hypothetical protein BDV25DRAFT_43056 [Aspergillus avenaceus]
METGPVQLDIPHIHRIFQGYPGESSSPYLTGALWIASPGIGHQRCPQVRICLVQDVTIPPRDAKPNGDKNLAPILRRLRGRSSEKAGTYRNRETLVQCDLWDTPDRATNDSGQTGLRYHFSIPVPHNIPGSTATLAGRVSYTIQATVTTTSGTTVTTTPLCVMRCTIPGHTRPVDYVRNYPGTALETALTITPAESPRLRSKASYALKLVARHTIAPGDRPKEVKHVVVRDIKWTVEETVRVVQGSTDRADQATCTHQYKRQLCHGKRKGPWIPGKTVLKDEQDAMNKDGRIEIPFDISIPRRSKTADDLSPFTETPQKVDVSPDQCTASIREKPTIAVEHQVILDIMTGEDTYDQQTGVLLRRKPLWKSFQASFPLPVRQVAAVEEIPPSLYAEDTTLPPYDDGSANPPSYETLLLS